MRVSGILILALLMLIPMVSGAQQQDEPAAKGNGSEAFLEGVRLYSEGNYNDAKRQFKNDLEKDPASDASYYYLSLISIAENEPVAGEAYIKEAIARDTANFWYYSTLAKIYVTTNRKDEAINVYEGVIKQFPAKTDIYLNLANLYLDGSHLEKAEEVLDKIEKVFGKNDEIALTKFNIFRYRNDWEGAINYLRRYDMGFDSPRLETLIGDLYADRFKDSLSMAYYNMALKNEPGYPGALLGLAEVYRNKGDYGNYFKLVKPLYSNPSLPLELKSGYLQQLMQSNLFLKNHKAQMDTLITEMLSCSNPDSTTLYLSAGFYAKVGETDKCIKMLRTNYEAYPNAKNPALQYLSYIYSAEDFELVEKESHTISAQFPQELFPVEIEIYSKIRLAKYSETIPLLERMRDMALRQKDSISLTNAYSLLGDTYHELGNASKCYQNYKKALEIDPDNVMVLNNYAYYLATSGKQLKKAYEYSSKTVAKEPDNPTYLDTFGWILYLMDRPLEAKSQFKHAMLYGGKESSFVLDHYAEVLYALGEYDLAFIYWDQAVAANNNVEKIEGLSEKIKLRKEQMKRGK